MIFYNHELRDKESNLDQLVKKLLKIIKTKKLIITRGKEGAYLYDVIKNEKFHCPAFANLIIDKVGAGDAMFGISAACLYTKIPNDLSLFFGSLIAANNVEDYVMGTKGSAKVLRHAVEVGGEEVFRYRGPKPSMYDVEHKELFAAIRSGETINNGDYMCKSTLMAILGREVCYTGQTVTWEQMLDSEQNLSPSVYQWGDVEIPKVAIPGKTKFV